MSPVNKTNKKDDTMTIKSPTASRGRVTKKKTPKLKTNSKKTTVTGRHRSTINPHANSFEKAVQDWMCVNFPDEVSENAKPRAENKERDPRNEPAGPTVGEYLGWLDSLQDRDEAKASNTPTKRYWDKFCEQPENKTMVASWKVYARDIRTKDGFEKFRPDFSNTDKKHLTKASRRRTRQLISFPSDEDFVRISFASVEDFGLKAAAPADEPAPDAAGDDQESAPRVSEKAAQSTGLKRKRGKQDLF